MASGEALQISVVISGQDAASPAILRAVASLAALEKSTQPARAALLALEQTGAQGAQRLAQAQGQAAQDAVRTAEQTGRAQVRAAADASRERLRLIQDTARAEEAAARETLKAAQGSGARTAAQEQLRAVQETNRERLRLAQDLSRAEIRLTQDTSRAQVQAARDAARESGRLQAGQALGGIGRGVISETVGGGLLVASGLGIAAATAAATHEVIRFGVEGQRAYRALENETRQVVTLFGETGRAADESFGRVNRQVTDLSRRLGIDAVQAARAYYQTISANVPREQAPGFLDVAARAAIGGSTTIVQATDAISNTMNAFGKSAADAEDVSNHLFVAVRDGKVTLDELSRTFYNLAPTASAAGLSLNETLAAVSTLTSRGVPAAEAMTRLRAVVDGIIRPSDEARRVQQLYNVQLDAGTLRADGWLGTLNRIYAATGGNETAITRLLGSSEAYQGVVTLMQDRGERLTQHFKDQTGAIDDTSRAYNEMEKNGQRAADRLQARWTEFSRSSAFNLVGPLLKVVELLDDIERRTHGIAVPGAQAAVADLTANPRRGGESASARIAREALAQLEAERTRRRAAALPDVPFSEAVERTADHRREERADQQQAHAQAAQADQRASENAAQARYEEARQRAEATHALEDQSRAAQRRVQDEQTAEEEASATRRRGLEQLQQTAAATERRLQDVRDRLDDSRQALERFVDAPLRGMGELEARLGGLQDRLAGFDLVIGGAQLERARARLEHRRPVIDRQAVRQATRERAVTQLELQQEETAGRLVFDPVTRQIRAALRPDEIDAATALAGVRGLAPTVRADEDRLRGMEPAQRAEQRRLQDQQLANARADQAARDRLEPLQRTARETARQAEDAAMKKQRDDEIARDLGRPPTGGAGSILVDPNLPAGSAALAGQRSTTGTPPTKALPDFSPTYNVQGVTREEMRSSLQEQNNRALNEFLDHVYGTGGGAPRGVPGAPG